MEYYNQYGKLVTYDSLKRKTTIRGGCSNVYIFDDYVMKKYLKYTHEDNRIYYELFQIISSLHNNHLLEIKELLIEKEKYDIKKSADDNFRTSIIDAYIAPYYETDLTNLLDKSIDFLLENLSEIEKLVQELSERQIVLDDIKPANTIVGENNIVIIDWDKYLQSSDAINVIMHINLKQILELFRRLYLEDCEYREEKNAIWHLFNIRNLNRELDQDKSITDKLSLRLKQCKTPRDYINKF